MSVRTKDRKKGLLSVDLTVFSGYYEYGDFPIEASLNPHMFKLRHFVGKGTFAR